MSKQFKLYFTFSPETLDPRNGNSLKNYFIEMIGDVDLFSKQYISSIDATGEKFGYFVFKNECRNVIHERFGRHWGMWWESHEFTGETCPGGCYERICLPISNIEIPSQEPFLNIDSRKKEMEGIGFTTPDEYENLKTKCRKLGFTEYIDNGYHFFYQTADVMLDITDPSPYFLLAERELGFFEELGISVNYCTANINDNKNYKQYLFEEDGKEKSLYLDLHADKVEVI